MRFAVTFAALACSTPVHAQNALETVIYMLHGVTNEAVAVSDSNQKIQPLSDKNGVEVVFGGNSVVTFLYNQISPCEYRMTRFLDSDHNPSTPKDEFFSIVMNWSNVSSVTLEPYSKSKENNYKKSIVKGLAVTSCRSLYAYTCNSVQNPDRLEGFFGGVGDIARTEKAYAYFREAFCKGSAF